MSKHLLDFRLLARVECPRQCRRIVGNVEDYRMGSHCDERCPSNIESGAIVDYHHHKFKYVDQHEHVVIVVAPELECTLNHFIRETNEPPESQSDGKSSSALQQTISNSCCKRCSRAIDISHLMPELGLSLL
jgi:hypothetical protein